MTDYSVELNNLIKYFGRRLIFDGISFSFSSGNIYGVSGPNGSGKSTLVKIIADVISPTRGKVDHKSGGRKIEFEELHNYLGFVSPYLFLYDEFTAEENLSYSCSIRGVKFNRERSDHLLGQLNLYDRRNDPVRGYSSGMKQRLKFIFALIHDPRLIILDEPTSNLDNPGKEIVYGIISEESKKNLIIIASNEDSDLKLCNEVIELEKFKKQVTG